MENEKLLRSLYDEASKTMDLGTYDNYLDKIKVPETRKSFYDMISEDGIDVGGYDRLSQVVDGYYSETPPEEAKKKGANPKPHPRYPFLIPIAPRAYLSRFWVAARDGFQKYG